MGFKRCFEISWCILEPVIFGRARSVTELVESAPPVQTTLVCSIGGIEGMFLQVGVIPADQPLRFF